MKKDSLTNHKSPLIQTTQNPPLAARANASTSHVPRVLHGHMEYEVQDDSIFVVIRRAHKKRNGFGRQSTRELMKISFEAGKEGRLTNSAAYSSHFFHLLMGMIPKERHIPYVRHCGASGETLKKVLSYLKDPKPNSTPFSSFFEAFCLYNALKDSFNFFPDLEKTTPLNTVPGASANLLEAERSQIESTFFSNSENAITFFEKHITLLEALADETRTISYIKEDFAPTLINCLETFLATEEMTTIETQDLDSVTMEMSDEGREIWKHHLEKGTTLGREFYDLHQLYPRISEEQKQKLKELLPKVREVYENRNPQRYPPAEENRLSVRLKR